MKAIVKAGIGIPSVRVKLLQRYFGLSTKRWYVECLVTSRKNNFYTVGTRLHVPYDALYLKEGILRGTNGKLYWQGKPDFNAIPLA